MLLCSFVAVRAQPRFVVAFWNVENLYDTVPSPFYDDSGYTPTEGWTGERYRAKLAALARTIDALSPDVLMLAEVENEAVVYDLADCLSDDYCVLHRTGSDRRGIDLAMLYRGDRFEPQRVGLVDLGAGREAFEVGGLLGNDTVTLIGVHLPSRFNSRAFRLRAAEGLARHLSRMGSDPHTGTLVLLGDVNDAPHGPVCRTIAAAGVKLGDPLRRAIDAGYGTTCYRNRWEMTDRIWVSDGTWNVVAAGVFVRDWMLDKPPYGGDRPARGIPRRTREGGASDHLPVFVVLEHRSFVC